MKIFPEFRSDVGNNIEYDVYAYCRYYAKNIQEHSEDNKIWEGISLDAFALNFAPNGLDPFIFNMVISSNGELERLQKAICDRCKINFCLLNFLALSTFVNVIIRARYYFLLQPTAKDLKEELTNNVKSVTFTKNDGKSVICESSEIITSLVNALDGCNTSSYDCRKIVRIDEGVKKETLQSLFVVKMSQFLQSYFPNAKRRANCCIVSKEEQDLILKLLGYYNLAPKDSPLTNGRFRQLVAKYDKLVDNNQIQQFGNMYIYGAFVPYSIWKQKGWMDKDWMDNTSELSLNSTINMNFSKEDCKKFSFTNLYKVTETVNNT